MARDRLMRAALAAAGRGMAVFPLLPGTKRPAVRRDWEGCATTDVEQIERWWIRAPYNVGVATGPSRLVVVDLDVSRDPGATRHGRDALVALARAAGVDTPHRTFTIATPSGGEHLYFRAPEGRNLTNTAGRLGPLVDTRAAGGYVVGAGSRIDRRYYRVVDAAEPAELPAWILAGLRPRVPALPPHSVPVSTAYVQAAVRAESRRVAEAAVGSRNSVLFQAAARLGRFVPTGRLAAAEVRSALTSAAERHLGTAGFRPGEVERAIASGLDRARCDADSGSVPPAGRRRVQGGDGRRESPDGRRHPR